MSGKAFASVGDMAEKKISFTEIGRNLYAFTAEGDPNTGVVIGDNAVMIVDAQATPRLAGKVIEHIRKVTDKPIKYVVLSHYHAVRVLGASAFRASEIIASEKCHAMIHERGQEDWDSEFGRFPRLFQGHESIPGLTWPTMTFKRKMTVDLGKRPVELMFVGRAHTAGDIVAFVPDANVMMTGDIVEYHSACYCGDAHFNDWPRSAIRLWPRLDRARPRRRPCWHCPSQRGARPHGRLRALDLSPGRAGRAARRLAQGCLGCLPHRMRSEILGLRHLRALPALQRRARV